MEKALQDLLASLGQTEAALQPFFEAGGKDAIAEVREKHGPKEAAEVQLAMAYTVNALFFAYLKTQGIDPGIGKNHLPMLIYSAASLLLGGQALSLGLLAELLVSRTADPDETYSVAERV